MTPHPLVHIHYLRPPDRKEVFTQELLLDDPEVKVTFARNVPFDPPIQILGEVALERGSDAVWFTFPGAWHDIGRFHTAEGLYTGLYANVLTPCVLHGFGSTPPLEWETTDLFLDVWMEPDGASHILDEPDLEEAVERRWVAPSTAARARREARRLQREAGMSWPPEVVGEWTLERAQAAVA